MSFSYCVYGLRCLSNVSIPGYIPENGTSGQPDIIWSIGLRPGWSRYAQSLPSRVAYAESSSDAAPISGCSLTSFGADEFFELVYPDGARFIVDRAGTRLAASWSPPLILEDVATYLRGSVSGFVLRRRGVTALHASAICLDGYAVLLCGAAEAGKSTAAAALAKRGISILSDDITAVRKSKDGFVVAPGYPWLCLWPDAVQTLFGDPDALPRLTPNWEKCYLPLQQGRYECVSRPVGAIYLLAQRVAEMTAPRVEGLSTGDALMGLVQNTYMNWLLDREQRAAEFAALTRLVRQVPVRRLVPHADPSRINSLVELVIQDAQRLISTSAGVQPEV